MGVQQLKTSYDRDKYRRDKSEYDEGVSLAKQISDYANCMSRNPAGFVDAVTREHRTIQQSIMRLFTECIYRWSETDYDMRNEETVRLCKRIVKEMELYYQGKPVLPCI
jgi:hypothetical protein